MSTKQPFKIGKYFTNVDLATGITTNLAEIELALKLNPGAFQAAVLFDQAKGATTGPKGYKTWAYPTGWQGDNSRQFSQEAWSTTGIGLIQASRASDEFLKILQSQAIGKKARYQDIIKGLLFKTSADIEILEIYDIYNRYLRAVEQSGLADAEFGISTPFSLLEEMQTGSPLSVNYLMDTLNSVDYFNGMPHAVLLSNHGGSYYSGGNADGPDDDLDSSERFLQVFELADSLEKAIQKYSPSKARIALLAYDECLMANVETLTQLSNVTRYFLASQEEIPGDGYDYFRTLSEYQSESSLSSQIEIEEAAKKLGLGFVNTYSERNPGSENTLSLTDTNGLAGLNQAIRTFADALIASSDAFVGKLLEAVKQNGFTYGEDSIEVHMNQDLGNIALIAQDVPEASVEIINASKAILQNLRAVVIKNNQGYNPWEEKHRPGASSGLTITFPTQLYQWNANRTATFKTKAPAFEAATGWSRVLEKTLPILRNVQTNGSSEKSRAVRNDGALERSLGAEAWILLENDEYLAFTSIDQDINSTQFLLPDYKDSAASLSDLEIHLDITNVRNQGTIVVTIEDQAGFEKARWEQKITQQGLVKFVGSQLDVSVGAISIESGDKIVLAPDQSISAAYDLNLLTKNHKLSSIPLSDIDGSNIFNFSIDLDAKQLINYETGRSANGEPITAEIVLQSKGEGVVRLSISDDTGGEVISFESDSYIDEYVQLQGNTRYSFEVEFTKNPNSSSSSASSNIALLINQSGSDNAIIADPLISSDVSIANWGSISINDSLEGSSFVVDFSTDADIKGLLDLQEGASIQGQYSARQISKTDELVDSPNGGMQTFTSGLWSSVSDALLNVWIEGTGANSARLGFFEVDTITGAIATDAGLIEASSSNLYRAAALDKLISPLVSLNGVDKQASIDVSVKSNTYFGAILLTEGPQTGETALFSIMAANPNRATQFLSFGDGYYGFEDLVQGSNASFDGDFNDITFYLA